MIRLAGSTSNYQEYPNLFFKDDALKREMIKDDIGLIISEFLDGGNEYIFGSLSDQFKESLNKKVNNLIRKQDRDARDKFINMIVDYTLTEKLNRGEARVRALKRFH